MVPRDYAPFDDSFHLRNLPIMYINIHKVGSFACRIDTVEGYDKPIILN